MAVCQAEEIFARMFVCTVRRPDFLLVIDGIGIIAVDANHRELSKIRRCYPLQQDTELRRVIMFERVFRLPVWYAYKGSEPDQWFWISALKAFEVGTESVSKHGKYLRIKLTDFVCIRTGEDFGKLNTQRMPGLGKLRANLGRRVSRFQRDGPIIEG